MQKCKKSRTFAPALLGTLAQVVEQWTENPCVLGSTPRGTTKEAHASFFVFDARLPRSPRTTRTTRPTSQLVASPTIPFQSFFDKCKLKRAKCGKKIANAEKSKQKFGNVKKIH